MKLNEIKKLYTTFRIEKMIDEETVKQKCIEAAEWINNNYKDKHPILIGTLKGAIPFMSEILKHLKIPVTIDFIMAKSYYREVHSTNVKIYKDIDLEIAERDVIIIEDIIDTGKTLKKLSQIFETRDINSIAYMTLIEKSTKDKSVKADFVGFKVKDEFLVGYGLDYAEMYRELPYIAKVYFNDKK